MEHLKWVGQYQSSTSQRGCFLATTHIHNHRGWTQFRNWDQKSNALRLSHGPIPMEFFVRHWCPFSLSPLRLDSLNYTATSQTERAPSHSKSHVWTLESYLLQPYSPIVRPHWSVPLSFSDVCLLFCRYCSEPFKSDCKVIESYLGFSKEICSCSTDRCNGATSLPASLSLLITLSLLSAIQF